MSDKCFICGKPRLEGSEWCAEHTENDAITSVEPGCTCGGVAACQQCQDRD